MRYIIVILIGVVIMGCSYGDEKDISECRAEQYQYLLGESIENIQKIDFEGKVRIIKPNMMVDMQFIPQRLNIRVDEKGKVKRVYCG
jgi:hypothetical protein